MITYQEFKELFVDKLKDYFPNDGIDREIVVKRRYKVNKEQDAIYLISESQKQGMAYVPVLYIEDMYKIYYSGTSLERIWKYVAETLLDYDPPKELIAATEKLKGWKKEVFLLSTAKKMKNC